MAIFTNLGDLEVVAHHIHTHLPHGRELALMLDAGVSQGWAEEGTEDVINATIQELYNIGEGILARNLEQGLKHAKRGDFDDFIEGMLAADRAQEETTEWGEQKPF